MIEYRYKATVDRWVDGDTVDVVIDLGFKVQTAQRLRLYGINTPERGQPGFDAATDFARARAPKGSTVEVKSYKTGKFGRWLAMIYVPNEAQSINRALVEEGLALEYLP